MPRQNGNSDRGHRRLPPAVNRYGSSQAYHTLIGRARKLGLDFKGHPTGIKQVGDKIYLYEDIGVGCVKPRVVRRVPPVDAREYTPQVAWA